MKTVYHVKVNTKKMKGDHKRLQGTVGALHKILKELAADPNVKNKMRFILTDSDVEFIKL